MVHQDPLGTSAWNASVSGVKLWAMFPPMLGKFIAGRELYRKGKGENREPFFFFKDVIPRIKKKYGIEPVIALQKPGDTVFVPSNWWHAVLNLTDTIAVTHNYVGSVNFDVVWREVKEKRKNLFKRWKKELRRNNYLRQKNKSDGLCQFNLTTVDEP